MAGGGPGANSRGRGGKFKKYTRGGGKHFSRDLRPLDADGNEISMWSADARAKKAGSDEDSEEDSSEEEEDSDEEAGPSAPAGELSREDRKKEKKARKEAALARARAQAVQVGDLPPSDEEEEEESDDDMPVNPNHSKAARSQTKAPVPSKAVEEAAEGVKAMKVSGTPNRREREALEAAQKKERWQKMHEAGKTDEAKADLARLRLIREKRDAEAARKQAEKEEREAQEAERKKEIEAKEAKRREAAMGPAVKGKKGKK